MMICRSQSLSRGGEEGGVWPTGIDASSLPTSNHQSKRMIMPLLEAESRIEPSPFTSEMQSGSVDQC